MPWVFDAAAIASPAGDALRIAYNFAVLAINRRPDPTGQAQHVVGAEKAGFWPSDRIVLECTARPDRPECQIRSTLQPKSLSQRLTNHSKLG